jgi:lipopolysaccharide export LptBFGC system permease protein LptF
MIFFFFLKRFLKQFCVAFLIITSVLGASNLLLRVQMISNPIVFIQIFFVMLPLMAIYAFPISASMAVQMAIGQLLVEDELLILKFLRPACRSLYLSVAAFAFTLTLIYTPLVFDFAPRSYLLGKKIILEFAKKQFYNLEAQKFHSPYPGFTFYFEKRRYEDGVPKFNTMFLAFSNKQNEQYIFTAKEGFFKNNNVFLLNGSVCTISEDKRYFAVFKESNINVEKLFHMEKDAKVLNVLKFWNIKQLVEKFKFDQDVLWEFLKRIAQILWMLLFPFLGLALIFRFGGKKSNLLVSVVTSGLIFLFSYISIAVAQVLSASFAVSLLFLFGPLFLLFFLLIRKGYSCS